MPIIIDEIEVFIYFHIIAILKFDLLIRNPCEKILQKELGSLNQEFGKTISATHSDIPMAERHSDNDPIEEVKFISPFVSPKLAYETERPLSPSLELKQCLWPFKPHSQ